MLDVKDKAFVIFEIEGVSLDFLVLELDETSWISLTSRDVVHPFNMKTGSPDSFSVLGFADFRASPVPQRYGSCVRSYGPISGIAVA